MILPLIRKFESHIQLSDAEKKALLQADVAVNEVEARWDLIKEGQPIDGACLVLEGFACRYKRMQDGRRQILSYILPGEMNDPRVFLLDKVDHSIGTLARTTVAMWPRKTLFNLTSAFPRIARAFWLCTLVDEAIQRQWLVNVGQRTALERLSHLFCELYFRLGAIGRVDGNSFDLPITQAELGDTLGLTAVHVNRILQDMRRDRLIRWSGKRMTILNLPALSIIAMFDPAYLRLRSDKQDMPGRHQATPLRQP